MPRDGSGIAAPITGSIAISGTVISSAEHNALVADVYSIFNGIQPVALGGTGQVSVEGFRTAFSVYSKAETTALLTAGYLPSKDTVDPTKAIAFNLAGITTATTRTVTWPNASGIVMLAELYPTANSLDGLLLASGDMLYATAENTLARLPKGTDGQILELAAGIPSWVNSSRLVKIASQPASGAAIGFLNLSAYSYLELVFENVSFSGVNSPYIRLSTDNGATYKGAAADYSGATGNDETGTAHSAEILLFDAPGVGFLNGVVEFRFFNDSAEQTVVSGLVRDGTTVEKIVSRRAAAELNNAILIAPSTGTMSTGTVTLWGRKR